MNQERNERIPRAFDYDKLNVSEISAKLDGLTVADLRKVESYEKDNKNRETVIEQIERKIKAAS